MSTLYETFQLVEEADKSQNLEDKMQRQILMSKLKGLNEHLSALLQKKIRIDLEIKRTKKKLSKLKSESEFYIRSKIELEGFNYDSLNQIELFFLKEAYGEGAFFDLCELDRQVYLASQLEKDLADLPLYED